MSDNNLFVHLVDVKTDNITDYKETSMLLVFPYCSGKCGPKCHNYRMIGTTKINEYNILDIINLYLKLETHNSVVCAGLEPFDSMLDLTNLVKCFSSCNKNCDIVIYTGYNEDEIEDNVKSLVETFDANVNKDYKKSLIVKFGRFIFDDSGKEVKNYSDILGINLASPNQYAKVLR